MAVINCCPNWRSTVPYMNCLFAWIIFIINIFAPGVGTIICGVVGCSFDCLLIGVLQILLAPFIIGWIWSIYWGFLCVEKSRGAPAVYVSV
jgi:hypothetical protein